MGVRLTGLVERGAGIHITGYHGTLILSIDNLVVLELWDGKSKVEIGNWDDAFVHDLLQRPSD